MPVELSVALSGLVETLLVNASEQAIIDRAVMSAVELLPIIGAGATLISSGDQPGKMAASDSVAFGLEGLQARLRQGPCLVAHAGREACLAPDIAGDGRFDRYGPAAVSAGAGGVFAFPMRFDGQSLGALDLYRAERGPLTDGEIVAAQTLCDVVAAILINAQRRAMQEDVATQLRAVAHRDALTGLPNRKLLIDRLEQALHRRARSKRMVAVTFVDLNEFKAVNDRHGHHVGDRLLAALADRLSAMLRPGDTLARWGGDEFIIVVEDIEDRRAVEQLHARIDAQLRAAFEIEHVSVRISASLGTVVSASDMDTAPALIDEADRAMYAVKHGRRPPENGGSPGGERTTAGNSEDTVGSDRWDERWIEGPTPNGGAFAHAIASVHRGELLITELDARSLVVRRYEWLPFDDSATTDGRVYELTVTDWDGLEIERVFVADVPLIPSSDGELRRALTDARAG